MAAKKVSPRRCLQHELLRSNHFGLAKDLKRRLKASAEKQNQGKRPEIIYLWACVTDSGLEHCLGDQQSERNALTLDQWLNVVDEASSLGAGWVVLTVTDALAACEKLWEVCSWAQRTHGMMVGLHLKGAPPSPADVQTIKQRLDLTRTRLLVRKELMKTLKWVEDEGIVLWTANPQEDGARPHCQGPTRMIFVNSKGMLYTCGLVEGNDSYRMGHVFESSLERLVSDPNLPHHVHDDMHIITPECDGCPSLVANFLDENIL